MGTRVIVTEPFLPRLSALVSRSNVLGPQCAGSAASRLARSGGSWVPADTRPRGRQEADPAGPAKRPGRWQLPVAPSPLAGTPGRAPESAPGDASGQGSGRPVRGCGSCGEGRRAASDGRERAPAPARRPCPPLPSPARLPRRPHPGQPRPPRPLAGLSPRTGAGQSRLSQPPLPVSSRTPLPPVPPCTVHRGERACLCTCVHGYMCATKVCACPTDRLPGVCVQACRLPHVCAAVQVWCGCAP